MRISDWSSDVGSSDLSLSVEDQCVQQAVQVLSRLCPPLRGKPRRLVDDDRLRILVDDHVLRKSDFVFAEVNGAHPLHRRCSLYFGGHARSEEHTSELPSLMRISSAVFCLKKKIS